MTARAARQSRTHHARRAAPVRPGQVRRRQHERGRGNEVTRFDQVVANGSSRRKASASQSSRWRGGRDRGAQAPVMSSAARLARQRGAAARRMPPRMRSSVTCVRVAGPSASHPATRAWFCNQPVVATPNARHGWLRNGPRGGSPASRRCAEPRRRRAHDRGLRATVAGQPRHANSGSRSLSAAACVRQQTWSNALLHSRGRVRLLSSNLTGRPRRLAAWWVLLCALTRRSLRGAFPFVGLRHARNVSGFENACPELVEWGCPAALDDLDRARRSPRPRSRPRWRRVSSGDDFVYHRALPRIPWRVPHLFTQEWSGGVWGSPRANSGRLRRSRSWATPAASRADAGLSRHEPRFTCCRPPASRAAWRYSAGRATRALPRGPRHRAASGARGGPSGGSPAASTFSGDRAALLFWLARIVSERGGWCHFIALVARSSSGFFPRNSASSPRCCCCSLAAARPARAARDLAPAFPRARRRHGGAGGLRRMPPGRVRHDNIGYNLWTDGPRGSGRPTISAGSCPPCRSPAAPNGGYFPRSARSSALARRRGRDGHRPRPRANPRPDRRRHRALLRRHLVSRERVSLTA